MFLDKIQRVVVVVSIEVVIFVAVVMVLAVVIVVAVVAGAVAVAGQRWVVAGFRNQHEGRIAEKKSTPNVQK